MNAALHLEAHDAVAKARKRYRAELIGIVEELARELGYAKSDVVQAARKGGAAVADETSELVIAARIAL